MGQVGRVIEVVQSGDIIAEVCGTNWTFSPAVLTRLDTEGAPLTPGTSREERERGREKEKDRDYLMVFFMIIFSRECQCYAASGL